MRSLLLAFFILALPAASFAGVFVSVGIAPPALPVYTQPVCPGDGYIWTPGYWGYSDEDGYYWVPGTWVEAPEPGYLWTPGYWGWGGNAYLWHDGYWGPHIGFYGGVNYGFGYTGEGYQGGYWDRGHFRYNRSVTNVNVTVVHNVYNKTVIVNNRTRVSYNGGRGGINRRPRAAEQRFSQERHIDRTPMQTQHERSAAGNRELRASVNHGKPAIAATERPGQFNGRGVVAARRAGAPYRAPAANRPAAAPRANNNNAAERPGNRPANNATHETPRPQSGVRTSPAARSTVARPPSEVKGAGESRAAGNARPARTPEQHNPPRPSNTPNQSAARENASRPVAPRAERAAAPKPSAPRAEKAPSAPRPERAPRAESRPSNAPNQSAARENASRPVAPRAERAAAP